jgi:hypothetical protein
MRNHLTGFCRTALAACVTGAALASRPAPAATPADGPAKIGFAATYRSASPLAKIIGGAADAALYTAATGNLSAAQSQADAAFLLACAYGTGRDTDAFREAAFTCRLIEQIAQAPDASRGELLTYLMAHPALAHTLVFAIRDGEDVGSVYALLDRLRRERPMQLERYPELATAICVVRSHAHVGFTEKNVAQADALDVFDFYVAHERQMFYGLRGVPVELLIYVVDNPVGLDDMNWALNKYSGTRDVGSLFFDISYDYDFYYGKAPQKLDSAPGGYTLPNILRVGGICVDQAYFATSVGKSIGIPSAWTDGDSATAGHAWVGFLKSTGQTAAWDFDSGRYDDYQYVRGNVKDPQTGATLADSTVGLLSDLIGTNPVMRENAIALIDAAEVWGATDGNSNLPAFPTGLVPASAKPPAARPTSADGQLDLVELGLRQFAAYPRGWAVVAKLAQEGKLSEAQKHTWADLTLRMCGQRHMDFALWLLEPMVETVADPDEQSALWDAIFKFVQSRPDLAASVRMKQALLWEQQNNLPRAGQCYEDVLQHYINAGPFALPALRGAESVLVALDQQPRVLDLYAEAAKLVTKPEMLSGRPEFIHESNWYRVREDYANKLEQAGQKQLADQIRSEDNG